MLECKQCMKCKQRAQTALSPRVPDYAILVIKDHRVIWSQHSICSQTRERVPTAQR